MKADIGSACMTVIYYPSFAEIHMDRAIFVPCDTTLFQVVIAGYMLKTHEDSDNAVMIAVTH